MKPSRAKTPARSALGAARTPLAGSVRTPLASLRTPISVRSTKTPSVHPRRQISREEAEKDPVEVYCRLRPGEDDTCVKIVDDTTVQLVPPATSKSYTSGKELQCSFKCK